VKFWWLRDFKRLAIEKSAVESISEAEPWLEIGSWALSAGRVAMEGTLIAHGAQYPIRLVYPDQFPDVPAWVEPQDAKARWSTHQYGAGGSLCLELRPDNWDPRATGADVLRSAYNLLVVENPAASPEAHGTAPSAHSVGTIQAYDWAAQSVFISAGCDERVRAGTAHDVLALRWPLAGESFPILIHDAEDRTSPWRPPAVNAENGLDEVPVIVSTRLAPENDASDLATLLPGVDASALEGMASKGCLVVFAARETVTIFNVFASGEAFRRATRVLPGMAGRRSGRQPSASSVRVAVIGTGSVGSKLAEILVRSGIGRLLLADGDVMLPGNIERHALDWRDVGFRKAHALKRRLLNIAPGADIDVKPNNLNWQRSAKTHAAEISAVAECDVIVDATGDSATALFLGAIADANRRPFVSIEVFEGGIGALIATCLPGRDAPFARARSGFLSWCEQCERPPPRSSQHSYEAFDDEGNSIVADDAAVTIAAGHAGRAILDIADGAPGPKEAAWLLVGFRNAWVFKGHGDTIRLSVGDPVEPTPSSVEDEEGKAFAVRLLEQVKDAVGDSS